MIYGLWKSATGVMTAGHRQGVIANNLANVETVGFKRDLSLVQERRMAAQEMPGLARFQDKLYSKLGGGSKLSPTATDYSAGTVEDTNRPYDAAIIGEGFFVAEKDGQKYLTRNGNFILDNRGRLILADGSNARVLSKDLSPIQLDPLARTHIGSRGEIMQNGVAAATLAVKKAEPSQVKKVGQQLLATSDVSALPNATESVVQGAALERSNVNPAGEMVAMLTAARELEANANMIRYQDQTLGRLVNDVGKI